MTSSVDLRASLQTDGYEKETDKIKNDSKLMLKTIATNARRAVQIGISMSNVFGVAIDQSLAMTVEAGLLAVEVYTAMALAGGISSLGLNALTGRLALQTAAIISLGVAVISAEAGRNDLSRSSAALSATFRMVTFNT